MIELEKFEEHLQTIKPQDWDTLFSWLPELEDTKKFGELDGGEPFGNGSIGAPYWTPTEIIDQVVHSICKLKILPAFVWGQWKEGKIILGQKDFDFNQLDTITLCKLLSTIIRANRFNDGYLVSCFKNGVVQKIIKAIKQNET